MYAQAEYFAEIMVEKGDIRTLGVQITHKKEGITDDQHEKQEWNTGRKNI